MYRNSPDWQESLDNFMIAQKLKRHNWEEVLFGRKRVLQYGFKNTLNLEGIVVYKETGKPLPDSTLLMVYLQNHMIGYEARTRKNGRIDLPFLFDFWGKDKIFYTLEINNKEVKNAEVRLIEDSITKITQLQHTESQKPDIYSDFTKKKSMINRSFNYFSSDNTSGKIELTNPNALFEDEVMGADIVVDVSRYIVFPTMEDLIREVIPSLIHRKSGGKPIVRIALSPTGTMPIGDPLYMIDGVMTKNTEYFLALKPSDILTVKVVKDVAKLSNLGTLGKNGIVFIQTKRPESMKLMSANATLPIEGLSKSVNFFMPDYSVDANKRERIPDFRSTLYWNPTVKTDASGKAMVNFYASDDLGLVKITVNGMTADGRPFSAETEVDISMRSVLK